LIENTRNPFFCRKKHTVIHGCVRVSPKQKGVFGKNAVAINVSQMLHYQIILKWCITPDREKIQGLLFIIHMIKIDGFS
jgi:hypothetical protein